jgi:hypothetical protein
MGENKAPNLSTHRLVYRKLDLVFNETIKLANNAAKFNQLYHSFLLQTKQSSQSTHLTLQGAGNLVEA